MAKHGDPRGKEVKRTGPIALPRRSRPNSWCGWLGAGLLNALSGCGLVAPFAAASLLGLAFAGSGGSRPGPVNWIAFAFTILVTVNLALGGLVAFVHTFRVRYPYMYGTVGLGACAAATPLIIVAYAIDGLLPSGFHALAHALRDALILRF